MEQYVDARRVQQRFGGFSERCVVRLVGAFEGREWAAPLQSSRLRRLSRTAASIAAAFKLAHRNRGGGR